MAPKWTDEQKKVIELHNRNILVSAAAGSGKTAVLVQRIIEMISDESKGIDIDKLLIVTYTNAAAFEMKERILGAIEKRMKDEPFNMHLRRQQSLLNHAQITTIDSFCLNVIRNYFSQIDLDPGFKVIDEGEGKLMFSDVMDEMVEEYYQEGRDSFYEFVECFTPEKNDSNLGEYVLELYHAAMSHPWPKEWLSKAKSVYGVNSKEEFLLTDMVKEAVLDLNKRIESAVELNKVAKQMASRIDGPYMYLEALNDDETFYDSLKDMNDPFECVNKMAAHKYARLSTKKDPNVDETLRENVKLIRNNIKDTLDKCVKMYQGQDLDKAFDVVKKASPLVEIYVEMAEKFIDRIAEYKRKKNVIDFSDMEHLALSILVQNENGVLSRTDVAKELAEQFEEIMIDEYQDSNMVQEIILNSISKEDKGSPNVFMVGDVKQSIYRFRLARPELFIDKYDRYTEDDSKYQKIELHNNFRSRKQVLESVNQVFDKIMRKEFGGISYDDNAKLYYGADFKSLEEANIGDESVSGIFDQKSEVYVIECGGDNEDTQIETEAKFVASQICKIVNSPEYSCLDKETEKYRKLQYKDIVILMRSLGNNADTFVNILASYGVPAISESGKGYFDSYEIAVVLNMLGVIDNPRQDIALFSVLKSYFGTFTSNELAIIKSMNKKKSFYDSFMEFGAGADNTTNNFDIIKKRDNFVELLKRYREIAKFKTIHELIWELVYNTGYYDYIGTMPLGESRQANIDMLIEKAKSYENTSFHGLFNFVRYIERLKSFDVDYGTASLESGNDNAVRIMTIHKSKGLEFPVVFLSNTHRGFNNQDANRKIVIDADMGIGMDYIDSQSRVVQSSIARKSIARKIRLANLSEEQRVLYVALTRAKEKLYVTGVVKDAAKAMTKWYEQAQRNLVYTDLVGAQNYLDMIMPAANVDNSGFNVLIVSSETISQSDSVKMQESNREIEDFKENICLHMDYEYPYRIVTHPMKMTVSELKHLGQNYDEDASFVKDYEAEKSTEPIVPLFISQKEEVLGAARGSAYHKVMELLDYAKCTDISSIARFIDECVNENRLALNTAQSIDQNDILIFINSSIGCEMKKAFDEGKLYRERQFVLGVPANEIDTNYETDEIILIQGVIDAYFETEDGLVLLDYKTDNVSMKNGEQELVDKYKKQLEYYEKALCQLTGKNVIKKSIYSFKLGKEIIL